MSRFVVFLVLLTIVAVIDARHTKYNHGKNNHRRNHDDSSDCDSSSSDSSSSGSDSSSSSSSSGSWNNYRWNYNRGKRDIGSKILECEKYEFWTECGRQCEPTCDNILPDNSCQLLKCDSSTAGCRCEEGYVRDNGKCMKVTECKFSSDKE